MKRRVKVWNKIRLYETSAVGIPAYPDAHASVESFSLVKALTNSSLKTGFVEEGEDIGDQLNLEEEETMEENSQVDKSAEVKTELVKAETVETEKSVKSDISEIVKTIKEGLKEGLKELETERGLVEKQTPRVKSIGEMAMEKGLFVLK